MCKKKSKPIIDLLVNEKSYDLKKKYRSQQKKAWRITIKESVADGELIFKFDAKIYLIMRRFTVLDIR
jgi:hypothetical protein